MSYRTTQAFVRHDPTEAMRLEAMWWRQQAYDEYRKRVEALRLRDIAFDRAGEAAP